MGEHVLDVGGKRWISVDVVPELPRSNTELDGEAEDIDQGIGTVDAQAARVAQFIQA